MFHVELFMEKINGFILSINEYKTNTYILKILCLNKGVISCLYGVNKKNIQNIYLMKSVCLIVKKTKSNDFYAIKTMENTQIADAVGLNFYKKTILVVFTELTCKFIKENEEQTNITTFLTYIIHELSISDNYKNFLIYFLVFWVQEMGISPILNYDEQNLYFHIEQSCFVPTFETDKTTINTQMSLFWQDVFQNTTLAHIKTLALNTYERNILVDYLLKYIEKHTGINAHVKSLSTFRELFA